MSIKLFGLVSHSANGLYTTQWLGRPDMQAIGATASVSRQRLIQLITKKQESLNLSSYDSWVDVAIFKKTFLVQAAHQVDNRSKLVGVPIPVPIRYLRISMKDGRRSCYLPELNLWLDWSTQGDNPPPELESAIRFRSAGIATERLLKWWPPLFSQVVTFPIQWQESTRSNQQNLDLFLESIAEPIFRKPSLFLPPDVRSQRPLKELKEFISSGGGIVVGDSGCGKSSLIEVACVELEAAARAERKQLPKEMRRGTNRRFWRTSAHRLMTGMPYLGQWQERLESVIQDLNERDGILILENLRDLARYGGKSARDSMAAFLVPFIRDRRLRVIVECTKRELDAVQQLVPGFVESLPIFNVDPWPPQVEEMLLDQLLKQRLSNCKKEFDSKVPQTVQRLCHQFQAASAPPSATVRFTEKLAEGLVNGTLSDPLTVNETVTQFASSYGVPEFLLRDEVPLDKKSIIQSLTNEVIGQSRPCEIVANVFSRIKSSLNDPGRPFANMFFCGPTGVGKTQLAKALAKNLFGYQQRKPPLIRVDMSEYSYPGAGSLFIQKSNGDPSDWLQQIRHRPLSVLLLDEIEKASPDVFDVLLSILDEGRVTDRFGLTTSLRSCVIVMTSNIGVRRSGSVGFNEDTQVDFASEIRRSFRPEFFNRLDEIVTFAPLSYEVVEAIAAKELKELATREGLVKRDIQLEWTDGLLKHLAKVGFRPELGARPLQKAIETKVVVPLSRWLLTHKKYRNCRLRVDINEQGAPIVCAELNESN